MEIESDQPTADPTEEVLRLARKRRQVAADAWRTSRLRFESDLRFLDGDQWPDNIKAERQADKRPCLSMPRLHGFVEDVVGDARQNRPAIKVRPVDSGADIPRAEILEGLIRQIEHKSNAATAYDTALEYAVSGNIGYILVNTEYAGDDVFEQDIVIERVKNPLAVHLDPDADRADFSDAKWAFVEEVLSEEEFRDRYPDASVRDFEQIAEDEAMASWYHQGKVRVAQYWYIEPRTRQLALIQRPGDPDTGAMPDPEVVELDERVTAESLAQVGATILRERTVQYGQVRRCRINGVEVLEEPVDWPGKYIPIVPVLGKELYVEGERRLRSLIHHAKDAQQLYNYWRTAEAEHVALAPKAPWVGTAKQFEGHEQLYQDAMLKNLAYLPYNPDPQAQGPPKRQDPPQVSPGLFQQAQQAAEDMQYSALIHDASLGAPSNERSGKAIRERKAQGDTATFAFIDNLARAITHVGQIIVDLAPKIYDTQRIIRIRNPDETDQAVTINHTQEDGTIVNDLTVGKYDVVVDVGPSFATQRIETSERLIQFVQAVPSTAEVGADLIAMAQDFPDAQELAKRFRGFLIQKGIVQRDPEKDPPPPPPTPQEQQMAALQKIELEAKLARAQADMAMAEAKSIEAQAKVASAPAELEAMIKKVMEEVLANNAEAQPAGMAGH